MTMTPKRITAAKAAKEYAELFQDEPDRARWEEILGGPSALLTIDMVDQLDAQGKISAGEYDVLAYIVNT
jgi:hypothetical protein